MNLNLESAQEARPSTTKPYYQDDQVTLYHGDAFEFIAGMEARSVDAVMTDPPYDERTHTMARSNNTGAPAGGRTHRGLSTTAAGTQKAPDSGIQSPGPSQ